MLPLRSLLSILLAISALSFAQIQDESFADEVDSLTIEDFRNLLEELPAESLHAVLDNHLAPKFQDGVFEQEHNAIQAIHSNNPLLATRLIELAKNDVVRAELRKRQNGTETTTTVEGGTTTTVVSTSTPVTTTSTQSPDTSSSAVTSSTTQVVVPPVTEPVTSTDSQGSTVTTSSVIPGTTSVESTSNTVAVSSPAIETTNTGFLVPVVVSSTDSAGSISVETTSAFEAATDASVSVDVPITTTNAQGNTITTSSAVAGIVVTSTNAQGQAVTATSALDSAVVNGLGSVITAAPSSRASTTRGSGSTEEGDDVTTTDSFGNTVVLNDVTAGEVITATDAKGSTFVTTYTPGGGRVSSLVLETTTLPNGQRSTITSFAMIGGQAATSTGTGAAATAATSTGPAPGLQSGVASGTKGYAKEMVALIGGAVGVAYLL